MHFLRSSKQEVSIGPLSQRTFPFLGLGHWSTEYIGKPYEPGARGPSDFDCWGLLLDVYRRFGITLPELDGISVASAIAIHRQIDLSAKEEWDEVEKPFDGAAVALSQRTAYHHVGLAVVTERPGILHAAEGDRVVIETTRALQLRGFKKITYFKHKSWPT